ncbi:hypothetical protein NEIRO03_0766 [Nematocida sp. AWRm78]|nr:hypothetical protein NEIRO02_1049 [Nematocida sp. AWRm79]KAI5183144.1 hypothetical protein NEIRO03_0766 [Nematocida sp. AWRm78]
MKESEVYELLRAYIDPAKTKEAEILARRINGDTEEITAFVKQLGSSPPKVKEIAALFLRHSLTLSLSQSAIQKGVDTQYYTTIFSHVCQHITQESEITDKLLYESISILSNALTLSDVLPVIELGRITQPDKTAVKTLNLLVRYTQKYRTKEKSDELYLEINHLIEVTKAIFHALVQCIIAHPDTEISLQIYICIYTIIYSILVHDIPDYYEENIEHYTTGLFIPINNNHLKNVHSTDPLVSTIRSAVVIQIQVASILISRYSDAYDSFVPFTSTMDRLYTTSELLDEGIQVEFMNYLQVLLNTHCRLDVQTVSTILKMLISKIVVDTDVGTVEYINELLQGDPTLTREISAGILKDLLARGALSLTDLIHHTVQQTAHGAPSKLQVSSVYIILYLIRSKYRLASGIYSEYIQHALHTVIKGDITNTHEVLGIAYAILILAVQYNIAGGLEDRAQDIFNAVDHLVTLNESAEVPEYILYISMGLAYTVYVHSKKNISYSARVNVFEYLLRTIKEECSDGPIKALFIYMKMHYNAVNAAGTNYAQDSTIQWFTNNIYPAVYKILLKSTETLSAASIKYLYDIVSLNVAYHPQSISNYNELLMYSVNNSVYEYNAYNILILSIINIIYGISHYIDISINIINNESIWKECIYSASYLYISLINSPQTAVKDLPERTIKFFTDCIINGQCGTVPVQVAGKYLNSEAVKYIFSQNNSDILLLRCISTLANENNQEQLRHIIDRFIARPIIPEEDTAYGITVLKECAEKSAHRKNEIERIIERLQTRKSKRKDEIDTIMLLEEIFKRK